MRLLLLPLGIAAGWALATALAPPAPPLPPNRWSNSALLGRYHQEVARWYEEFDQYAPAGLFAAHFIASENEKSRLDQFYGQGILGRKKGVLEGTLVSSFSPAARGSLRLTVRCPKEDLGCCVAIESRRAQEDFQPHRKTNSLPPDAYFNPAGNLVTAHFASLPGFSVGLPFAGTVWEIPLRGEKETKLVGFDPDRLGWREVGTVAWQQRAAYPGESCL